jgi:hypothetical protein
MCFCRNLFFHEQINPYVAKARELQRQGIKGKGVIIYFEPLITPHLKSSRFPESVKI